MTQEEKDLLLKDLCARLPYGVKVNILGEYQHAENLFGLDVYKQTFNLKYAYNQPMFTRHGDSVIKPYLRPMKSMTEEEKKEEWELWDIVTKTRNDLHYLYTDFLISHHFDYRALIEKGLALEAPEGMYEIVPTSI